MKKQIVYKICFIFFMLLISLLIVNFIFAVDIDETVKNFKKEYKNMKNFCADFEQTTLVAGKKRVANGKLIFQKPNLLRQEYFDPSNPKNMTQLIVSDGKTILSYTPMLKQVNKQDLSSRKNPELFPGFGKALENIEKNYDIKEAKDELAEKKGIYSFELTPKNQDEKSGPTFDFIQVWIRNEDLVPIQIMYKDNKNETTFFISFKNVSLNDKLNESIFKFTIPAGVQVITVPNK